MSIMGALSAQLAVLPSTLQILFLNSIFFPFEETSLTAVILRNIPPFSILVMKCYR